MNICVFGDSIVWGANDFEKGGWVERLKVHCLQDGSNRDVYNLGISGDNTDKLLKRLEFETTLREPDVIVLAIGINDSQYISTKDNHRIGLEKFKDNLSELTKISKKFTDKIIFVGLTMVNEARTMPILWNRTKYYDNESIKNYDIAIRNFCQENKIRYIDMQEIVKIQDLEDGLHPNSTGHNKIFLRVKEEINILQLAQNKIT